MLSMGEYLDTSDYPVSHPLHSNLNKKVMAKFKDELNGIAVEEFVGLKAKMYSLLYANDESHCTAKGIKKQVVKKTFNHKMYVDSLKLSKSNYVLQNQIVGRKHEVFTVRINKMALNPFDDKRYIISDGVSTLAHGHYNIIKFE